MALTLEALKKKARMTPHSDACERGSGDTYLAVYGRRDPDCPRCGLNDKARDIAAKRLFG